MKNDVSNLLLLSVLRSGNKTVTEHVNPLLRDDRKRRIQAKCPCRDGGLPFRPGSRKPMLNRDHYYPNVKHILNNSAMTDFQPDGALQ